MKGGGGKKSPPLSGETVSLKLTGQLEHYSSHGNEQCHAQQRGRGYRGRDEVGANRRVAEGGCKRQHDGEGDGYQDDSYEHLLTGRTCFCQISIHSLI